MQRLPPAIRLTCQTLQAAARRGLQPPLSRVRPLARIRHPCLLLLRFRALRGVEELGFDTVWNFDHMLPFAGRDDGACFETWTTLAAMAAHTTRIRIGALVNGVLYRDPATLAKSAAQVDIISNGRLEFSL